MPRPKAFEPDKVLEAAMHVFWRRGFSGTSILDLNRATGLNSPSLYNAFGDKHELFLSALNHYIHTVLDEALAKLHSPGSPRLAIESALRTTAERHAADLEHKGCLVLNTALEFPEDGKVGRRLAQTFEAVEEAFYTTVLHAQQEREIDPGHDPRALARYLVGNLQGLNAVARFGVTKAFYDDALECIMRSLN